MSAYEHAELRAATPRQKAALQRMHSKLGASRRKVGRWPFRRLEWYVSCPDCGWEAQKTVPVMPPEMRLTESFLLRGLMEAHLADALRKLTFRDVWLRGGS